ncbi:hypothetical protein F2P81_009881 [Scophthalmus maximus]|uniref:Uncharacterized protein n=1 Tax=Scophthalmus maximus TaxID=52904 RepID=A0A6A4SU73_SCOMX|nr:hypothetical protein F2P81_009881 [Scophthalmus maximus]
MAPDRFQAQGEITNLTKTRTQNQMLPLTERGGRGRAQRSYLRGDYAAAGRRLVVDGGAMNADAPPQRRSRGPPRVEWRECAGVTKNTEARAFGNKAEIVRQIQIWKCCLIDKTTISRRIGTKWTAQKRAAPAEAPIDAVSSFHSGRREQQATTTTMSGKKQHNAAASGKEMDYTGESLYRSCSAHRPSFSLLAALLTRRLSTRLAAGVNVATAFLK